jgi:hypothetical protein
MRVNSFYLVSAGIILRWMGWQEGKEAEDVEGEAVSTALHI